MPMQMLAESVEIKKRPNLIIQSNTYKQSISLAMLSNARGHGLVHQITVLKAKTAHYNTRKH